MTTFAIILIVINIITSVTAPQVYHEKHANSFDCNTAVIIRAINTILHCLQFLNGSPVAISDALKHSTLVILCTNWKFLSQKWAHVQKSLADGNMDCISHK